jgi:hypothetical protein
MLRQTHEKPIQIKRAAGNANIDWRLRADSTSKAYRVERRAGDAWRGIASFLVSLGGCRPPEPEVPPLEQTAPAKPGNPAPEH